MRSALAYAPRPGPLGSSGPGPAAAYLGVLALIALVFANPIVIAGAGAAVVVSGLVSNARSSLATASRWALALAALIALVNGLVVRRGDTVLVRGFDVPLLGPLDITLEALAEGAVLGLRVVVVLLAFAVFSACVDPDRMLGALRPIARRSALTATLITRLVPLTGRDHARLREAASLRGPAAAPVGRAASARRLLAGSLDRASDVAATLELRGYGLPPPPRPPRERRGGRRSPNPSSLLLVALALLSLCVAVGARVAGIGSFDAYPTIRLDAGAETLALALLLPLLALLLLIRRSAEPPARWATRSPRAQSADPAPIRAASGDAVLEIAGLSYRYPGADSNAIDRVGLDVHEGELVVLAGSSGSGKTSLLRAACGLIPHFHGGEIAGSVLVAGRDLRDHGPSELAAAAGFVAQDPETQVVSAVAGSELELPLSARTRAPAPRVSRVAEVAAELGIGHLLERTSDSLSAGELQRVAIAAALVASPRLLLLDEPTSQLDPDAARELSALIHRIRASGTAIVIAEHRLGRWCAVADRVAVMERGMLVFDGDPASAGRELRMPGGAGQDRTRNGAAPPRSHDTELALELSDLSVELDTRPSPVLEHVELSIHCGERVALVGANGAGKSTLLRASAGVLRPASGRVRTPRGCALLGQNPGDYIVRERVADELPGDGGAAALAAVGLAWAGELDPRDLSGGERQRLALAIALAGRGIGGEPPGLVCLDEPTRGMDRAHMDGLTKLVGRLSERGAAIVVATHDLEFAAGFADRAIVIDHGAVVADGDLMDLIGNGGFP